MSGWRSDGKNFSGSGPGPSPGPIHSHSSGSRQFHSSGSGPSSNPGTTANPEYCETIVSMLSMLSCSDQASAHRAILAITNSPESCQALRKAGCIPLLIQILHPTNLPKESHPTPETKNRAARALKNIVLYNTDEKAKRNELRVLKLLESIRRYSDQLRSGKDEGEKHPVQSSTTLMKLSFDEDHKNMMCLLGGIHTLADLIQTDHSAHGINQNPDCIIIRRYSGMTLLNLTFGDGANKALLCSMRDFIDALVAQLDCQNEDICQVTASVLRNLSWHADSSSRAALRDSNAVTELTAAAIKSTKEPTLKATLSALWNLSAHSVSNKMAICRSPNAISFLISLLNYKSKTLTIVENAGGILRNVSTIIGNDDEIRAEFRACGLSEILLDQLKSSSLIVVSNACGMLWHLSENCSEDQNRLLELGAVPKLKALMYSKHDGIAQGASAALKNLLNYAYEQNSPTSPQAEESEVHHPMDLRMSTTSGAENSNNSNQNSKPSKLAFQAQGQSHSQEEPLDLSLHSTKSSPIHVVSALEFGARPPKSTPVFLNPPLQISLTRKYFSPKNYDSCPEFLGYSLQPAHQALAIDFTGGKSEQQHTHIVEDSTINYSLHYSESAADECRKSEDTVKTYCCEGTPLNFSTSNSMSDLTAIDRPSKLKPIVEAAGDAHSICNGDMDLPQKYCTEHTPANFSRASSLSSIASNIQGGENKAEYLEEISSLKSGTGMSTSTSTSTSHGIGIEREKVKRNVTFSANETPLMFSRSSSLNSLDSVEITYEDGGSVVSEFSRRPSEAVSPSDLPDSPRQICAPEPPPGFSDKIEQTPVGSAEHEEDSVKHFNSCESGAVSGMISVRSLSPLMVDGESVGVKMKMDTSPPIMPAPIKELVEMEESTPLNCAHPPETNENMPRIFAVEGTPFHASNATSLSDLMGELDKEDEHPNANAQAKLQNDSSPDEKHEEQQENSTVPEPIYSDAQILQKCIKAGKAARNIPRSKSEFSKLNTKENVKMSQSYHESLKPGFGDPKLAALIQEGKNRARGLNRQPVPLSKGNEELVLPQKVPRMREVEKTCDVVDVKKIEAAVIPVPKERVDQNQASCISILNQKSTTSILSEWNDDTATISSLIPSMSISTAFRIAEMKGDVDNSRSELLSEEADPALQSTLSKMEPPSGFSALVSSTDCKKKSDETESSNLFNQKPPPELFDLESSMISVASLKSEVASMAMIDSRMKDLSIGADGETYTIGGGCCSDGTDAEDSLAEELNSFEEVLNPLEKIQEIVPSPQPRPSTGSPKRAENTQHSPERFLTFTKRHSSPRQKRREDPTRYLTRTISPMSDSNGNLNPMNNTNGFGTFKVEKSSPRILTRQQISATSAESSPTGSPKGIRGRRKHLYASLPPQKKIAPPIPPKPMPILPSVIPSSTSGGVFVRPTRTSALRAAVVAAGAGSHDASSKHSSKNSSSNSLNNFSQPPSSIASGSAVSSASGFAARKTPPKPPVRTSLSSPSKNFAVVRAVRNSNSSIGFANEARATETGYNTLPRSGGGLKPAPEQQPAKTGGKLSNLWNQLTKSKTDNSKNGHHSHSTRTDHGIDKSSNSGEKKSSKFGFSFGKKKKDVWLKREDETVNSIVGKEKVEREKAFVLPFNYNNQKKGQQKPSSTIPAVDSSSGHSHSGASGTNSKMTTV